jgi:hypothetical protein
MAIKPAGSGIIGPQDDGELKRVSGNRPPAVTYTIKHGDRLTWVCRLFGHWMKWEVLALGESAMGTCRICTHCRSTHVYWGMGT